MQSEAAYDAVVLAGGTGRRLGGIDKAGLEVGGRSLLDRVLEALGAAGRVVVVGPERSLPVGVLATSESPAGGGPVAGVAAGLALVRTPLVAVLACDLPFLSALTVARLLAELVADRSGRFDGAQLVDATGRRQPLAAVYRTPQLVAAIGDLVQVADTPMRDVLARLTMLDVEAEPEQAWDCDTWADVERARSRVADHLVEER